MKSVATMLFAFAVFNTASVAQITITSSDASAINAVGSVITNHYDSLTTSVNIGSPGATSWNFSALNSGFTNLSTSVIPSSTPYLASDFPTANVVFKYRVLIDGDSADGWQYATLDVSNLRRNGTVSRTVIGSDTLLVKDIFSPTQLDIPLPFTFGSQWGSAFTITSTTYFNGTPFFATTANHTETVTVDAWGPMTMPGGAVHQALRVRRDDRYTSPSPPFYVRTISYTFLAKSGAVVDLVARDTSAPSSGVIQVDGVTWGNVNTVSVEDELHTPDHFSLRQNYPNPFNPSTTIAFFIPQSSFVILKVYNLIGQEVATLVDEFRPAGGHDVDFDATQLPSGTYFYTLRAGAFAQTKSMLLIK